MFTFYVYYASIKHNCTLLMRYCHITGGVLIRVQISRSIGIPVATSQCLYEKPSVYEINNRVRKT